LFFEEEGKVYIANASLIALRRMQMAMEGEAAKAGLVSEDDVNYLVKSIRKDDTVEIKDQHTKNEDHHAKIKD
jgi:hypothetical protein